MKVSININEKRRVSLVELLRIVKKEKFKSNLPKHLHLTIDKFDELPDEFFVANNFVSVVEKDGVTGLFVDNEDFINEVYKESLLEALDMGLNTLDDFNRNIPLYDLVLRKKSDLEVKHKVKMVWPTSEDSDHVESSEVTKQYELPILKQDEDQRLVTGIVMEPDEVDTQGDIVKEPLILKACHEFMMNSQVIGLQHKKLAKSIKVVENYISPMDMMLGGQEVKKGSWVMTVKILNDSLWEGVKKGDYTGFSIGGFAVKEEVKVDA